MRAFFGAVVLALLFAMQASAFTPGPTIIRECPKCRAPIEQPTMASGNTFGARFWSDGKMAAPMLPDYPWLVKCPNCKHLFWIDEAKKLGDARKGWKGQGKLKPRVLDVPTASDFCNAVSRVHDKRKQRYIRNHLWHLANDPYRDRAPAAKLSLSEQARANMIALSRLLNERDPEERLTKAEIARELGQFDRCLKLLNARFDKRLSNAVSAIKMLAQERYAPVVEFTRHSRYQKRTAPANTEPADTENRLFARSMRESCVYVANGLLARYGIDALLRSDPEKLRSAIAAGAAKGNNSGVAEALDIAVAEGSVDAVRFLLDNGARVNGCSSDPPLPPLMTACLSRNEGMARLLIDRGADVNAKSEYELTPLTIACRERSAGIAKLLLDKGAKVDQAGYNGSPLMMLCTYTWDRPDNMGKVDFARRTLEMTKLLVDRGADVNGLEPAAGDPEAEFRSTPLIEICDTEFGRDEFAIDRYTKAEKTACEEIYMDIIRFLLDSKADVNKTDYDGRSPLACACRAGNLGAVKLLLERGADVNKASKDGTTPLTMASRLSDKSIAKLLLEHGAKPKTEK